MIRLTPLLLMLANTAHAAWPDIRLGGLAQPQLKWEQNDPNVTETNPRNSGFALHRARLVAEATLKGSKILWEARVEGEMIPTFALLDAYLRASGDTRGGGFWQLTLGQHFAPFSRQTALSAATLQMVDFAQLTTLTPGRQLGLTGTLAVPFAPWLQLSAGVYNGKGTNVIENIDTNFMYVGRIAFRPMAPRAPMLESALGPNAIWLACNVSYNQKKLGDYNEVTLLVGADAFVSYKGFSAYVEYLWGNVSYTAGAPKKPYHLQGFNAQAGYLLPIPGWLFRRLEVAFRFEAVAPNQTVALTGPGDPTQARASYVAGLGYYHRGHNIKLQVNYSHNQELDDRDATGRVLSYDNDSVIAQLTYRLE